MPVARALLILAAALAVTPAWVIASPALRLDLAGGDAWTFHKAITGRILTGTCEDVWIRSGAGRIQALVQNHQFVATVPLVSGPNRIQAECLQHGAWVARSNIQRWTVRLRDVPRAWIRTRIDGNTVYMDAGASEAAPAVPARIVSYRWRARADNPALLVFSAENPNGIASGRRLESAEDPPNTPRISIKPPQLDGDYYVTLEITDSLGRRDESTGTFRVTNGQPREVDVEHGHPTWVDSTILYGAVPFFFGQDGFAAITRRLDSIKALGATAIWLSPVAEAAKGDFGYAVTDPFRLRAAFGSEAQFRALIEAAHARGLRVLLDSVVNHLSDQHPYYIDTLLRGRRSAYYDWFERDAHGAVVHYFDWKNLQNLNFDHPEVRSYLTESLAHWVRDYHIDGFRIDASWTLRERAPELWSRIRQEIERENPDVLLLAEGSARDPYYATHGFDAAYDWTHKLGEWAWHDVFGAPEALPDLPRLRQELMQSVECARDGLRTSTLVARFLDNNDTGARFITQHGVEETRVAAALLLTLPGIPIIYNGDEVGAAFEPYNQGPPIDWSDVQKLTPLYQRLTRLRREEPALRSRDLILLRTDHPESVLAYIRGFGAAGSCAPAADDRSAAARLADCGSMSLSADSAQRASAPTGRVWVALNFSSAPVDVSLLDADATEVASRAHTVEDLLTGEISEVPASPPTLGLNQESRTANAPRSAAVLHIAAYGAVLLRAGSAAASLPPPAR